MRAMKDSGVEWIGEIPEDWKVIKLKYLFYIGKGLSITKENLQHNGFPVISYGQIHAKFNSGTKIVPELIRYVSNRYTLTNPECIAKPGDVIFADTSEDLEGCGNCVYVDNESSVLAGYHTILLHGLHQSNNKFLTYLFQTPSWRAQIRSQVSGIKVFSISQKILKETWVILPLEEEQQRITEYLDEKCGAIDRLIVQKQSVISKLTEYKKSLIYEAVTGKREV